MRAITNSYQSVTWNFNVIRMFGSLASNDIFSFSAGIYNIAIKKGYKDITLDFSGAYPVRETFMVPAIAIVRDYRRQGVTFNLIHPEQQSARSIFHNANWSHLVNDTEHDATTFDGDGHLPASAYRTSAEQTAAVDRVMSMILKAVPLDRKQLAALEWAVSEVTDNVLNHAQSATGGVIQASTMISDGKQMVEFVVADTGIGIRQSLGERTDVQALERAIQEGVTRNQNTNQGNGLFGSFQVATLSNGRFEIHSGHGSLVAKGSSSLNAFKRKSFHYPGTLVVCRIGCDNEKLIENALTFKGKVYEPGFDYLEKKYEGEKENEFVFTMANECSSFTSREGGKGARLLIENLLRAEPTFALSIDFLGVSIISSSFADEVFGRLFVVLGPTAFMSRINFRNISSSVRAILDRSITLRIFQHMNE